MGNYMDGTFAAIDGVLLWYGGEDISLKLPRQLADMQIHTIGDGAVMESGKLQQVVVPDGIKRIGDRSFRRCAHLMSAYLPYSVESYACTAFSFCPKLVNLYIYNIGLSERQYLDLKSSASRVNGTVYLTSSFPDLQRICDAISSTDVSPANCIQSGISRLFTSQSLDEEKGASSMLRNLDGFGFNSPDRYKTEEAELFRMLAAGERSETDAACEEENDRFLKTDRNEPIEKTAVFSFDDGKTKIENGRYTIFADVRIGYHFWQSVVPVRNEGKNYYIYRRHYLSSKPGLNYVRRDVAVCSEKGIIKNRKEVQTVYAKYRLLSIL